MDFYLPGIGRSTGRTTGGNNTGGGGGTSSTDGSTVNSNGLITGTPGQNAAAAAAATQGSIYSTYNSLLTNTNLTDDQKQAVKDYFKSSDAANIIDMYTLNTGATKDQYASKYNSLINTLNGYVANPNTIYVAPPIPRDTIVKSGNTAPTTGLLQPPPQPVTPETVAPAPTTTLPTSPDPATWDMDKSKFGFLGANFNKPFNQTPYTPVTTPQFTSLDTSAPINAYKSQPAADLMSWQDTGIPQAKSTNTDYLNEYGINKGKTIDPLPTQINPATGLLQTETPAEKQARLDKAAYLPQQNTYLKDYKLGWQAYA